MKRKATFNLTLLMLLGAVVPGCIFDYPNDNAVETVTEITYSYQDSSLPPEYHRSYTITVTADTAKVVIENYSEILVNEEYAVTEKQFAGVKESLVTNNIRACELGDNIPCPGGSSENVTYSDAEEELFSGTVYNCGGEDSGDMCGDVASFAEAVKSLVPNFEELLEGTIEE